MEEESQKLPRRVRVGYGTAHMGIMAVEMAIRLHLLFFCTDTLGLKPELAGLAMAIGVIWDAITDPLMGIISDRTHSPWGKRRIYILSGSFLLALAVFVLFSPPHLESQSFKFAYILVSYLFLNTCMTVIAVPHYALGGELSGDRHIRNEVYGWLVFFTCLGLLAGLLLPGLALEQIDLKEATVEDKMTAYRQASLIIGLLVVLTAGITFLSTSGRDLSYEQQMKLGLKDFFVSLWSVVKNKAFLPLLLAYIVAYLGLGINAAMAFYYYRYHLDLPQSEIYIIIAAFMFMMLLSIPLWIWLAGKFGKKWPAFAGIFSLGLLTTSTYPFLPLGEFWPPMIVGVMGGIMSGSALLLYSLVPDIVDYDEVKTGEHREGLFFGLINMGTKVSRAASVGAAGFMLSLIGFVPRQVPTESVSKGLAWIFGPGVGLFILAGAVIFAFMPFTEKDHQKVQKILKKRKVRRGKEE